MLQYAVDLFVVTDVVRGHLGSGDENIATAVGLLGQYNLLQVSLLHWAGEGKMGYVLSS